MDKRKVALTFLKNFLIAGTTIGLYSIIMEFYSPPVVGFIHGALPITFTYLVFLTWLKHRKKLNKMLFVSGISGCLWVGFVFLLYALVVYGLSLPTSYAITLAVFVVACGLFCKQFYEYF
jgi:hypothetical protein